MTTENNKLRSYWSRPGGKFGTLLAIGGLAAVGWWVIPILTTIVWGLVNFSIALGVAGALLYVLMDGRIRKSVFYLYEIAVKKLVGVVSDIDPFIIIQNHIKSMIRERDLCLEEGTKVDAQKEKLDAELKDKEREMKMEYDKARVAKESGNNAQVALSTRIAERNAEYIKRLTPMRNNMEQLGNYIQKIYDNSYYVIEDAKQELKIKIDEYNAVTAGNKAMKSAMRIFNLNVDDRLMLEQSMEHLKDDVAGKLASLKKSIKLTSGVVEGIDLQNATYEAQGLRMLEEYSSTDEILKYRDGGQPIKISVQEVPGTVTPDRYKDILQ
jgi:hypothetical protein